MVVRVTLELRQIVASATIEKSTQEISVKDDYFTCESKTLMES